MSPHRDERTGTMLALFSGACFGTIPILARFAYDSGWTRESILFWRFALAALVLLPLALRRGGVPRLGQIASCVALGMLGYGSESLCYFTAVARVGAGVTSILLYLYPSFVTLMAWVTDGE